MSYEVQVEGMRDDARKWTGFSDTLSGCQGSLQAGADGNARFGLIANFVSLGTAHDELNAMVRGLLGDGATWFDDVAVGLNDTADVYAETDANESGRYDGGN